MAELGRELVTRSTLKLVTGFVVLTAAMAVLAATAGDALELVTGPPYLFAPTLLCPIAAHRVLRDRDTGMTGVLATTPLPRSHGLATKTLATLLLTPLAVAASLPILYAASLATAPGAFLKLLIYPAWAISIGTTAALVGLVVGHLTPKSRRLGLGLSFGVVLLWFLLGLGLGQTPNPPAVLAFLRRLSPLSHAVQAEGIGALPGGPAVLLLLPLTLAAIALAALPIVALGLQHATGWDTPLQRHPLAIGALAGILVLGTVGLVAWSVPEEDPPRGSLLAKDIEVGDLRVSSRFIQPGWREDPAWGQGATLRLNLEVVGPPNKTVSVDRIALTSETLDPQAQGTLPASLELDDVFQDRGKRWNATGGTAGKATLNATFLVHPRELFSSTEAELVIELDGVEHRQGVLFIASEWQVERDPILVAAGGTLVPLFGMAWWLPRRWNRW